MKKAKLRVSDQMMFQEEVCSDCLNDNGEDKMCFILGELAYSGECDMVYQMDKIDKDTGCFFKCMMRRIEEEVSVDSIIKWINETSTEEVANVLDEIEASYHFDVLRDNRIVNKEMR